MVGNFDEVPVSFNGEFLRAMVVSLDEIAEGTFAFETSGAHDPERIFTYLPLIMVNVDGTQVQHQPKPILIFKGEGNVYKNEKALYIQVYLCISRRRLLLMRLS